MLTFVVEPQADGTFAAGYKIPGCSVFTPSTICRTEAQANEAAGRLNEERAAFEKRIKADQVARGLRIFKPTGV